MVGRHDHDCVVREPVCVQSLEGSRTCLTGRMMRHWDIPPVGGPSCRLKTPRLRSNSAPGMQFNQNSRIVGAGMRNVTTNLLPILLRLISSRLSIFCRRADIHRADNDNTACIGNHVQGGEEHLYTARAVNHVPRTPVQKCGARTNPLAPTPDSQSNFTATPVGGSMCLANRMWFLAGTVAR